ncbi:MAG: hypothetical protein A2161_06715 [Candidatus Schekmanbacteria bacterium RBG_13_48_7]|uniref:Response regulatory domain-containing protein n=1 Tax=Candidatus Schekmanbacteria bacterium RBG_13_48_7 TaxID=1817878 RepID=A0A1F7RLC2_9BACT|nr:MAG: hypothetical protein A2161_06715 [Candidatus Schekmanbacteria bacterium RBG_13_48_7]
MHLLLVDDEIDFLESTSKILTHRGMQVQTAENGRSAFSKLEKQLFDVIVLDIRMPDMDGIETLKIIKERWSKTMVILLTGHATVQSATTGLNQGAYAYLTKPHDINELTQMILAAYKKKKEIEKKEIANMIDEYIRRMPG